MPPARDVTFGAALRATQQSLAAGLQHARYPVRTHLSRFLGVNAPSSATPRAILYSIWRSPRIRKTVWSAASLRLAPISAPDYELTDASPGQDMVLIHEALADGGLLLQWHVNAALYTRETARVLV